MIPAYCCPTLFIPFLLCLHAKIQQTAVHTYICTISIIIFYHLSDSGDEEQNDADEEGIVIDDYDDFDEEYEDNEKGHNKKKSSIVLSTDIQKKTGARNRISIDFDATETTKEIPNKSQKAPEKSDVYQENVTKIRFPASKSSSCTKPPSVKAILSERLRFPDKPTRTSPVKISIPPKKPETSVTAGKGTEYRLCEVF